MFAQKSDLVVCLWVVKIALAVSGYLVALALAFAFFLLAIYSGLKAVAKDLTSTG